MLAKAAKAKPIFLITNPSNPNAGAWLLRRKVVVKAAPLAGDGRSLGGTLFNLDPRTKLEQDRAWTS
jgi:hypothetical protein